MKECLLVGMEDDFLGGRMEENAWEVGWRKVSW
jgi:hypothetical protein